MVALDSIEVRPGCHAGPIVLLRHVNKELAIRSVVRSQSQFLTLHIITLGGLLSELSCPFCPRSPLLGYLVCNSSVVIWCKPSQATCIVTRLKVEIIEDRMGYEGG